MKKIGIFVIVIVVLLFAGCVRSKHDDETIPPTTAPQPTVPTTLPPETTIPVETTVATETTVPPEETTPNESGISKLSWFYGDVPIDTTVWPDNDPSITYFTEDDINNFMRIFSYPFDRFAWHPENPYNMAMCCAFDSPENIQLHYLFYNGFHDSEPITDEERAFMDVGGLDIIRCEPEKMNPVLEALFGITLDDINWDIQKMKYWDKTDCYYLAHTDYLALMELEILRGYATEDGIVKIHYKGYFDKEFIMTLQSRSVEHEYGYYIISNLPLR